MNVFTLLKKDHRNVERLLERYRVATRGKRAIVAKITRELSAHMAAEEQELYPVLRHAIESGASLVKDAEKEHSEARGLLAELPALAEGSFEMDAKVATLRGAIAHHVRDEEGEIFPKAERALGSARLNELGTRVARAKRAAPKAPNRSAARKSPGASMTGVAFAAVDRVRTVFASPAPKKRRARSSSTSRRSRKAASARSKIRATRTKGRSKSAARRAKRR
jgi:hemerythrin superfamily protein